MIDGSICIICRIFLINDDRVPAPNNINFTGYLYENVKSALKYPIDSEFNGVLQVKSISIVQRTYSLANVNVKCVLFEVNQKIYIIV